jgi:hypothetical protein
VKSDAYRCLALKIVTRHAQVAKRQQSDSFVPDHRQTLCVLSMLLDGQIAKSPQKSGR